MCFLAYGSAVNARLGSRALFPQLRARSYLNHAAISPLSSAVVNAISRVLSKYAGDGLGAFFAGLETREQLRARLGSFIGARAQEIGFTQNTTAGVSAIANMIPWQRGDRIVVFEGEFPANVTPWQRAASTYDLDLAWVPLEPFRRSWDEGLALLEEELKRGVRVVAVSFVQFQTGLRMPVEAIGELAHRYGAELFVDAIQGLGAVPLDVQHIDYLSCGGHKWLMGPEGAGFIYVDEARIGHLEPRLAGWLSHEDALVFLGEPNELRYDRAIRQDASIVEQGAQSSLGLAGLDASTTLIASLGVEAIYEHLQTFNDRLEPELVARGFESKRVAHARSGSLCVVPPQTRTLKEWSAALAEHGIAVSTPDGHLRFAPHWPNALDEVDAIVNAVDAS